MKCSLQMYVLDHIQTQMHTVGWRHPKHVQQRPRLLQLAAMMVFSLPDHGYTYILLYISALKI